MESHRFSALFLLDVSREITTKEINIKYRGRNVKTLNMRGENAEQTDSWIGLGDC